MFALAKMDVRIKKNASFALTVNTPLRNIGKAHHDYRES